MIYINCTVFMTCYYETPWAGFWPRKGRLKIEGSKRTVWLRSSGGTKLFCHMMGERFPVSRSSVVFCWGPGVQLADTDSCPLSSLHSGLSHPSLERGGQSSPPAWIWQGGWAPLWQLWWRWTITGAQPWLFLALCVWLPLLCAFS